MTAPRQDCPFCRHNWRNLDIVDQNSTGSIIAITPLNPVTDGHVLVIHHNHYTSAAESPDQASNLMMFAAKYVAKHGIEANLITSIGPAATQTVQHTHLHVVPRTEGDGLRLPWTDQHTHAAEIGAAAVAENDRQDIALANLVAEVDAEIVDGPSKTATATDITPVVAPKLTKAELKRKFEQTRGTQRDKPQVEKDEKPRSKKHERKAEVVDAEVVEPPAAPGPPPPITYLGKGGSVIGTKPL